MADTTAQDDNSHESATIPEFVNMKDARAASRRYFAWLIDTIIASILGSIPVIGWLLGGGYMLFRDGLGVIDNRSLGKHCTKLKAIRIDGQPIDLATSARRNISFSVVFLLSIVPFVGPMLTILCLVFVGAIEYIVALTDAKGQRFGDRWAKTKVVKVAD